MWKENRQILRPKVRSVIGRCVVNIMLGEGYNAAPAWSSFASKEQEGKIDAFIRRSFHCGFCQQLLTFRQIAGKACQCHTVPCLQASPILVINCQLLPPTRSTHYASTWQRTLPTCMFMLQLYKYFNNRWLFEYIARCFHDSFCLLSVCCSCFFLFHFSIVLCTFVLHN